MQNSAYYKQAELLLKVLPFINKDKELALKGGTAINFFVRDMPRLSVDIDLVYLPLQGREEALNNITEKLRQIGSAVTKNITDAQVVERKLSKTDYLSGVQIRTKDASIKIEPNTVIRGSVFDPVEMRLCSKAEELFELSIKTQCLSIADLYGGKICAALDRQHPRDLFDVKLLFENEGFTEEIRKAFIVYLISHVRPMVEVLNPNMNDIRSTFEREFKGMTEESLDLDKLTETFDKLKRTIKESLTSEEKKFLLTFKKRNPEWRLLGLNNIEKLPSVQWKLLNLEKMVKSKHQEAVKKLSNYLES